jgi:hypothetical protein
MVQWPGVAHGLGRLQYWLLDVVAEYTAPLCALPDGEVELWLNRPGSGASRAELARGLATLLHLGLVTGATAEGGDLGAAEIERALGGPREQTWYGLTEAGGVAWEQAAKPDWRSYVWYAREEEGGAWGHTILCADPALAARYLAYQRAIWLKPGVVAEESLRHDTVRPWEATYWKTLPAAHRIRFNTGAEPNRWPDPGDLARSEFPDGVPRWHRDPRDAAGPLS